MKILKIIIFFFLFFKVQAQNKFVLLDTLDSQKFKSELLEFYQTKFNNFNSKLNLNSQSKIYKNVYLEHQNEFLEKIKLNNFVSDKNINSYLQKLVEEILGKNKVDKNDYKILISKDSEINAYNTGDGSVIVNYGLFTVLESEDELVFVLCHEISHQQLQHVRKEIELFVKQSTSDEIINKTKEIKKLKFNKASAANSLLMKLNYKNYYQRRKKEIEADSLGFIYYKNTNRELRNTISLLQKLDVSNSEKDSLTIQNYKDIFETDLFKLKNKYFEMEKSIFNKYDYKPSYDIDSLKTHPDCATRIKKLEKLISKQLSKVDSTDNFSEIKKNASNQNLINLYLNKEYGICLYQTLKKFINNKENLFYRELIYLNLVEIQKSKLNQTTSKYIPQIDNINNSVSLNRFITFINNIRVHDLEIIISQYK